MTNLHDPSIDTFAGTSYYFNVKDAQVTQSIYKERLENGSN